MFRTCLLHMISAFLCIYGWACVNIFYLSTFCVFGCQIFVILSMQRVLKQVLGESTHQCTCIYRFVVFIHYSISRC
jgi:hypothetical protein